LLDDESPLPAAKKRSGETRGAFGIAARKFTLRSLAHRVFRTAKAILSRSQPTVAPFGAEAFGPPDPCNPFDPVWQPRLFLDREPKGGYGGYFAEIILLPRGVKPATKTAPQRPEPAESGDAHNSN
jgi:hypothetical protein